MLINKKAVKTLALDVARSERGGKFTRVSNEFLEHIDFKLRDVVRTHIKSLPSVGKTIK